MGLPSYVVNFDELVDLLTSYLNDGIKVNLDGINIDTKTLENLLDAIKNDIEDVRFDNLTDALKELGTKIDILGNNLGWTGVQKIYGKMLEVPAAEGKYIVELPSNGKITGITYSQSSWNYEDTWDLVVDDNKLFDNVTTKQYGEHKYFNTYYNLETGATIKFIYNNNSGANKVVWIDFCILEGD